jgi:ABC-type lipoprotein release transport system permease subunit
VRLGIKGIIKYKALNQIFGHFNIVDVESYRECLGYFAASEKIEVSSEKKKLLDMENESIDLLFETDSMFVQDTGKPDTDITRLKITGKNIQKQPVDLEAGAYNLIVVKIKDGFNSADSLRKLNAVLAENKLGARVVAWERASGVIGSMSVIIKTTLFMFVMFLFFVAIIIIVNTLSMTALERTPEIGMMRAVGARKGFIGKMFLGETSMLSFVFGGFGIIVGIILVNVLPLLNVTTDNDMIQLIFGGERLSPVLSMPDILLTILQLAAVTLIAVIYPIKVANGITPLDAVTKD